MFSITAFDWEIMVRSHRNLLGLHCFPRWLQSSFCCTVHYAIVCEVFPLVGRRPDWLHGEKSSVIMAVPCSSSASSYVFRHGGCSSSPCCLQYNYAKWSISTTSVWIWGKNSVMLKCLIRAHGRQYIINHVAEFCCLKEHVISLFTKTPPPPPQKKNDLNKKFHTDDIALTIGCPLALNFQHTSNLGEQGE